MQARINSILRENELLKHQLKKYVGAVQKLRDGPQAHETLAQLEGDYFVPKYVNLHVFPNSNLTMISPDS